MDAVEVFKIGFIGGIALIKGSDFKQGRWHVLLIVYYLSIDTQADLNLLFIDLYLFYCH